MINGHPRWQSAGEPRRYVIFMYLTLHPTLRHGKRVYHHFRVSKPSTWAALEPYALLKPTLGFHCIHFHCYNTSSYSSF
jgi:hypothetical protein